MTTINIDNRDFDFIFPPQELQNSRHIVPEKKKHSYLKKITKRKNKNSQAITSII